MGISIRPVSDLEAKVKTINSIQINYKSLRQRSKSCSFALQYGSTAKGLEINNGFIPSEAKRIYDNYHKAYVKSLEWKNQHIKSACEKGYITTGFGLKVRTPYLHGAGEVLNSLQSAEARTAGNALGQGWGMLNDRAMNKVLEQVDKLGLSTSILPVGKVHDSTYYLVKNDLSTVLLLNQLTVEQANWSKHPDIYHPEVGLGGNLEIYYTNWSNPIELPNECTEEQLLAICKEYS